LYVSELLGHSTPAITMSVYQHTRMDRLEAAQAVGDAVFGAPGANMAQTTRSEGEPS
jgi:hypothetical protein